MRCFRATSKKVKSQNKGTILIGLRLLFIFRIVSGNDSVKIVSAYSTLISDKIIPDEVGFGGIYINYQSPTG